MYCGIQPSEINEMDATEVELFMIYFEELHKSEMGGLNGRK